MNKTVNKRVALIPARGGSKRLPRKNILDFDGKPIIAYTIEAALSSGCFDEVVVSTEDDEIAKIALAYNALVDHRSPSLSTDEATVVDVCLDYLNRHPASILAVLYATAPLRTANDIQNVFNLLSDQCHFAMAATLCERPMHQALSFDEGNVSPVFPELVNKRSDRVDTYCVDNGSTYIVQVKPFLQQKTFYGDSLHAYLMPTLRSIDIDTIEDFQWAMHQKKALLKPKLVETRCFVSKRG